MELIDAYRDDLRSALRGLLAVTVVFGLAYATFRLVAFKLRRALNRARRTSERRFKRALRYRKQVHALRAELATVTAKAVELASAVAVAEIESRRQLAIRAKLDRGLKVKSAELEKAQSDLRWAEKMIPPTIQHLTVDIEL